MENKMMNPGDIINTKKCFCDFNYVVVRGSLYLKNLITVLNRHSPSMAHLYSTLPLFLQVSHPTKQTLIIKAYFLKNPVLAHM